MNNLRIILVFAVALCFIGCSSKKDNYKGLSAEQIYTQAETNLSKENFAQAAKDFEALEARFPYGEFSDRAQLGLIEAYYKQNEPALALSAADRFIRMNPRHPKVDYAYYLKGLVTYDQNYTFMFRYLPLDKSARDPSSSQESFDAFKELIERFPSSKYAADARQRMIHLRDLLSKHELQVIKFYMKRGAFLSAANRASYIVKNFHQTNAVPDALAAMVVSYQHLGMVNLANDALKTLECNFPNSEALQSVQP